MFYENHIDGDKTGQANHLLLFKYEFETRRRGETEDSHICNFHGAVGKDEDGGQTDVDGDDGPISSFRCCSCKNPLRLTRHVYSLRIFP